MHHTKPFVTRRHKHGETFYNDAVSVAAAEPRHRRSQDIATHMGGGLKYSPLLAVLSPKKWSILVCLLAVALWEDSLPCVARAFCRSASACLPSAVGIWITWAIEWWRWARTMVVHFLYSAVIATFCGFVLLLDMTCWTWCGAMKAKAAETALFVTERLWSLWSMARCAR